MRMPTRSDHRAHVRVLLKWSLLVLAALVTFASLATIAGIVHNGRVAWVALLDSGPVSLDASLTSRDFLQPAAGFLLAVAASFVAGRLFGQRKDLVESSRQT